MAVFAKDLAAKESICPKKGQKEKEK